MRTPRASSTSALPHVPLAERFPCLATGTPQAATTTEATVEMLNVPAPSPPVPQVSTAPDEVSGTARARMARAKPTTSSSVSPRAAMAARRAPIWAGGGLAVHDRTHGRGRVLLGEALAAGELREVALDVDGGAEAEEIPQQVLPGRGEDALGVKTARPREGARGAADP